MSIQNDKIISISVSTVTISVIFDNIETNGGVIMAVANNIKRFRKMNNLYQKELADKIGTSSQVISNWERGYTKPNDDDLVRLADALDCSVDELLGRQPKPIIDSLDDLDVLMFSDKEGFDNLSEEEQEEIKNMINEQLEYLIHKKNKDK